MKLPYIIECFPSNCFNVYVIALIILNPLRGKERGFFNLWLKFKSESTSFLSMQPLNVLNIQLFFGALSYLILTISPQWFPDLYFSLKTLGGVPWSSVSVHFPPLFLVGPGASYNTVPTYLRDRLIYFIFTPYNLYYCCFPALFCFCIFAFRLFSLSSSFPLHYYLMKFYPFIKYFLILLVWINLSFLVVDCELPPPKPLFP